MSWAVPYTVADAHRDGRHDRYSWWRIICPECRHPSPAASGEGSDRG